MADYLLVDGYNVIFAWEQLREMAESNLDAARFKLQEILSDYQGYTSDTVIVVFDGYKVKGNPGSISKYDNIFIVFTREAETADQYIERVSAEYVKDGLVRVVTSDALEQVIIMGKGARRVDVNDFIAEFMQMKKDMKEQYLSRNRKYNPLIDNVSPEVAAYLEKRRLMDDE